MAKPQLSPRVRVAAIIVKGDSILLVRHEKPSGATYWLLPGGGVDYGESLAEGLKREVREETGLEVSVGDLVLASDTIAPDGSRHVVNLCFRAPVTGGALRAGDEPELAEVAYRPIAELPRLDLRPGVAADLVALLADDKVSGARYLGRIWKK